MEHMVTKNILTNREEGNEAETKEAENNSKVRICCNQTKYTEGRQFNWRMKMIIMPRFFIV